MLDWIVNSTAFWITVAVLAIICMLAHSARLP